MSLVELADPTLGEFVLVVRYHGNGGGGKVMRGCGFCERRL